MILQKAKCKEAAFCFAYICELKQINLKTHLGTTTIIWPFSSFHGWIFPAWRSFWLLLFELPIVPSLFSFFFQQRQVRNSVNICRAFPQELSGHSLSLFMTGHICRLSCSLPYCIVNSLPTLTLRCPWALFIPRWVIFWLTLVRLLLLFYFILI